MYFLLDYPQPHTYGQQTFRSLILSHAALPVPEFPVRLMSHWKLHTLFRFCCPDEYSNPQDKTPHRFELPSLHNYLRPQTPFASDSYEYENSSQDTEILPFVLSLTAIILLLFQNE